MQDNFGEICYNFQTRGGMGISNMSNMCHEGPSLGYCDVRGTTYWLYVIEYNNNIDMVGRRQVLCSFCFHLTL